MTTKKELLFCKIVFFSISDTLFKITNVHHKEENRPSLWVPVFIVRKIHKTWVKGNSQEVLKFHEPDLGKAQDFWIWKKEIQC